MLNSESVSYKNWAIRIGILIKKTVSKQAMWKRMTVEQVRFLEEVLKETMQKSIGEKVSEEAKTKFKYFNRVLLEDSTHIKVSDKLSEEYPGNSYWDKKANKAIVKIQTLYDLVGKSFIRFEITSFRKNDQGYSKKILEIVKKGDLVIRDLGYFILRTFQNLNTRGVYYISRLKKGVLVFTKEEEEPIDLAKMLRGRGELDISVFIGEEERVPVRLIAIPVEEKVASERRRKAKNNRDRRCNPGKEHLFLLGWELFITNVEAEHIGKQEIAEIYFLRWRIEIIFKCWKSYFKITGVPGDGNKIRLDAFIYYMLIFIVLFQVSFYRYCLERWAKASSEIKERYLSMMQVMQYVASNISFLFETDYSNKEDFNSLIDQIIYHCRYDSRNDRRNYMSKLMELS
jgi:hypothetical protein